MQYLLGLIAALVGGLFYYKTKAKSAESLNENTKVKESLLNEDKNIAENSGRVLSQKARIETIQSDTNKELEKVQTNEELASFLSKFADRNKPKQ